MTGIVGAVAVTALALSAFSLLIVLGLARRMRGMAAAGPTPAASGGSLPTVGASAPDFSFVDVSGDEVRGSRLDTGRHAVAFVSSACDACRDSVPVFAELAGQVGTDRSLAVLLDDSTDRGVAVEFIERLRSRTTVLVEDLDRDVSKRFGVTSFPTFVGVDEGRIELSTHKVKDLVGWIGP
jgi:thiol-disulfide isomerase/thioredoxin